MKIKKNKDALHKQTEKRTISGIIKMVASGFGIILAFSAVLSMIMNYASPNKYVTTSDIEQQFAIVESEGGQYAGHLVESIYEGEGRFQYLLGGEYSGEFTESMRSGEGTFTWPNGDEFTGTWIEDQMLEGIYTFSDGACYDGTFENNSFDTGLYDLSASAEAKGFTAFKAAVEGGNVTRISFTMKDGLKYEGDLSGEADIQYPSGNQYSGDVKNGVRDGDGVFKWMSDGKVTASYKGSWKDGSMSGTGSYYYSGESYPYITGTFVNGKPDGTATYYKASGNTFSTIWSNGSCTKVTES